jgi:gluconokinase
VGKLVAARLGAEFADGDDFHPEANVAKMTAGIPLTDEDRWPWLDTIIAWMDQRAAAGETAVVACSALRRSYRDMLLTSAARPRMVFLEISREVAEARLRNRFGHYFQVGMLASQFATLEPPAPPEQVTVVQAIGTPDEIADEVIAALG